MSAPLLAQDPGELFDVLHADGSPAGFSRARSEVHRRGDWHRAVHVWVLRPDDRILLQQRSAAKDSHPLLWDVSCAGHVSAGSCAIDSAVRELDEELGLAVEAGALEPLFQFRHQVVLDGGRFLDNEVIDVYLLRADIAEAALRPSPAEVAAVRFVPRTELIARVERRDPTLVPHRDEYAQLFPRLAALRSA